MSRLHGEGPILLVLPHENAPFEAYRPLNDDPTPRSIVFEGFHEWMIHSKAYAETEWKGVEQWNAPTSSFLQPGETTSVALRFATAPGIRQIEETLAQQNRPVAVGIPGYVVPQDVPAKLFLNYASDVTAIESYPANALLGVTSGSPTKHGWKAYEIAGKQWGRARLTVTYANGLQQTISYKVIKPEKEAVDDLGHFLTTEQWYENENDLFGRSPSVINYDYETKRLLTQESRTWFAGLSDEAGAGSWLTAIMKQVLRPNKTEVDKLKRAYHTAMAMVKHAPYYAQFGQMEVSIFPLGT